MGTAVLALGAGVIGAGAIGAVKRVLREAGLLESEQTAALLEGDTVHDLGVLLVGTAVLVLIMFGPLLAGGPA